MSDPSPRPEPAGRARAWAGAAAGASLVVILLLVAFATSGPAQAPAQAGAPTAGAAAPSYTDDIQPIFDKRCVACHGCLGSPCNLKLTSYRAAERGAFGENPYSSHLEASPRTGMNVVQTTAEWRKRGFYPVLSRGGSKTQNLQRSLLYQMIEAGTRHNTPGFSRKALMPLYADRYAHQCPATPEALGTQLKQNPAAGMPFGLPSLDDDDFQTLRDWVASGSPGPTEAELRSAETVAVPAAVLAWENFLNADDKRSQLVARYIFDHVFLATIVLEESPGDYFKLVRSKTPPGDAAANPPAPVEIIDTPLPYSDPYAYAGVDRFYYRLKKITAPIVQKNHFVWRLGHADIDHLKTLFLHSKWDDQAKLDAPGGSAIPFWCTRPSRRKRATASFWRIPS